MVRVGRQPTAVHVRRHLDRVPGRPRNQVQAYPRPHPVYGFLTAAPNAIVAPIHPKADEERDEAKPLQRSLPEDALKVAMRDAEKADKAVA